jgi:hypothetical protein
VNNEYDRRMVKKSSLYDTPPYLPLISLANVRSIDAVTNGLDFAESSEVTEENDRSSSAPFMKGCGVGSRLIGGVMDVWPDNLGLLLDTEDLYTYTPLASKHSSSEVD